MLNSLREKRKILTIGLILLILAIGLPYQYHYHHKEKRYREIIGDYYRKHLKQEPDEKGLKHWTTWALNKWTLEEVEERGFIRVAREKGI